MRKELSRLDRWKKQEIRNQRLKEEMKKKYQMKNKSIEVLIEELKQRITANAMKLKRYEARTEQFIQNRLFETNQKKLFQRLEKNECSEQAMPDKKEATEFWNGIWNKPVEHNEKADWLKQVEEELTSDRKQPNLSITKDTLKIKLRKVKNWKAPGPDGLSRLLDKIIYSLP